jgi:NNP family nitrate/nitrite transporter-like MFS transporter
MQPTAGPRSRWLPRWEPEDEQFWATAGRRVAVRNLVLSVLAEHVGFSVFSLWSVLVLFLGPDTGFSFTAGQKFLLVTVPALVGGLLRIPYGRAVTRFGGRDWTVAASLLLVIPCALAAVLVHAPGTPFWVFLLVAATAGVGGGGFASSMANINLLFPARHKGWALGVNAGGGNVAVAVVQLVGLLVLATAGSAGATTVVAIYLPLVAAVAVVAALGMDNVPGLRAQGPAQRRAARVPHTWGLSLLYVGTFGSFIGFGFAFGLVLQDQFGFGATESASLTFLGPLLGSAFRPVGGGLADRFGGARVSLAVFAAMAAGAAVLLVASSGSHLGAFLGAFAVLFVLTGLGNGSTYAMIPAVFADRARRRIAEGAERGGELAEARSLSSAVITIAGSIGALGGVGINLAFRVSYGSAAHSGGPAFAVFLGFYAVCALLIATAYLRSSAPVEPEVVVS